ncbi:hypothetical protein [Hymenobacter nivis]|uniref:DUF2946 domain-containing protein n=1 Tax=Hymenobacter nivis TaxID=1850093 RepID=A0A2Z3GW35_9BACT|nr:hypothetical protein [Hymenobacter nivis]AWM35225.1 hypothetical protein DDQ68_22120 [Hymenobacter nivis]
MKPRSLAHRIVSLWLAVLVLTASVGLTVEQHTCRFSGRSRANLALLGAAPRRCYGATAPPRIKDNCCEFSSHWHKLTAPAHAHALEKVPVPGPLLAAWLPGAAWPQLPVSEAARGTAGPRWFAADASPPPRGGRALLRWVGKLVV